MTEEQVPLTREFTIGPGDARRAAWALTRTTVVRPVGVVLVGLAVLVGVAGIVRGATLWPALAILSFGVLLPFLIYLLGRRRFGIVFPPGTVVKVGFGDTVFRTEAVDTGSSLTYAFYERARRVGDVVVLGDGRVVSSYLPGSLFTDEDLARFPRTR